MNVLIFKFEQNKNDRRQVLNSDEPKNNKY